MVSDVIKNHHFSVSSYNTRRLEPNNFNESKAETIITPTIRVFSELHLELQNFLTNLRTRYDTEVAKALYIKSPRENISREFSVKLLRLGSKQLYNSQPILLITLIQNQNDDNTILLISMMVEYMFHNTAIGTLELFEKCLRMNIDIADVLIVLQDIQLLLDQLTPNIRDRIFGITDSNAMNNMQVLQKISSDRIAQQELDDKNEHDNEFITNNINAINENLQQVLSEGIASPTNKTICKQIENWWHDTINDSTHFHLNLETPPHGETTIFNTQKITNRVELISMLFTTIDITFNNCIQDKTPIIDKFQDSISQLMSHMVLYLNRLNEINNTSCAHHLGIKPSSNEIINLLNEDEKRNITRTKPFVDAHGSIKLVLTGITHLFERIQYHYPIRKP